MNNDNLVSLAVNRVKIIIKTSIIGIITNIFLATFKAVIGFFSNSIAMILDAVNNLSDAMSSLITIIGAIFGAKKPDKYHPFGYGRVEYITSMIVASIVFYAGIASLIESVRKIFYPETADYGFDDIFIMVVAIIVKLILGRYVKEQGEKVNSGALIASGSEASFDAVLSASVLASTVIFLIWNISLEAYVGVLISIFIIKTGVEIMLETLNDIIGRRGDPNMSKKIKSLLNEEPEVKGTYDLILFDYGPTKYYASVHIEIPDVMTVDEVDLLIRRLQLKVFRNTGVVLSGVSVYSYDTKNKDSVIIRDKIQEVVLSHEWALQMHGFYLDNKTILFDVVMSFDVDKKIALKTLIKEVQALYPEYNFIIVPDADTSD